MIENSITGSTYFMTVFQPPFTLLTMVDIGSETAKYLPNATTMVVYIDAIMEIL